MKLTTDQINYLNIGLMLFSAVLAFVLPFELFLFSYAVLGPLHYLTEISWLHDRNYFVETKREKKVRRAWLVLVFATLALMLYGLYTEKVLRDSLAPVYEIGLFYLVFVTALMVMFVRRGVVGIALILLTAVGLFFFSATKYYALIAFFLITIIHVFVFTAAFILYGALKGKSRSGILSLAVFILCIASFFVIRPHGTLTVVSEFVKHNYGSFTTLNAELIKLFRLGPGTTLSEIYNSTAGLVVMRLIAFAYTYHYLNWFSKTSIIKWHEIPTSRIFAIIVLWVVSLGVYAYSYEVGLGALYFLSVLHVMLEFPLNHLTFAGIGRELSGFTRRAA